MGYKSANTGKDTSSSYNTYSGSHQGLGGTANPPPHPHSHSYSHPHVGHGLHHGAHIHHGNPNHPAHLMMPHHGPQSASLPPHINSPHIPHLISHGHPSHGIYLPTNSIDHHSPNTSLASTGSAAGSLSSGSTSHATSSPIASVSNSSIPSWSIHDEVDALLHKLIPQTQSNNKREMIRLYLESLLRFHLKDYSLVLAEAGSTWTRTYLPDGDLDLVLHIGPSSNYNDIAVRSGDSDSSPAPASPLLSSTSSTSSSSTTSTSGPPSCLNPPSMLDVIHIIYNEMITSVYSLTNKQFNDITIRNLEFINARTKLITCLVNNISVDITVNQQSTVNNPMFLALADEIVWTIHNNKEKDIKSLFKKPASEKQGEIKTPITPSSPSEFFTPSSGSIFSPGNTHLLKRSLILIKTWCLHDSRLYSPSNLSLLLSKKGTMSTSALNLLVLFIFNIFHKSIHHPLDALRIFFAFYRNFPWDLYIVSLDGLVPINPNLLSEQDNSSSYYDDTQPNHALLHGNFDYSSLLHGKVVNIFKTIYDHESFNSFYTFSRQSKMHGHGLSHTSSGTGSYSVNIPIKTVNIIDPCDPSNNLGLSVSKFHLPTLKKTLDSAFHHFEGLIYRSTLPAHLPEHLPNNSHSSLLHAHMEIIRRITYDLFPITFSTYILNISTRSDLLDHPIQANHLPENDFDYYFQDYLKSPTSSLTSSSTSATSAVSHYNYESLESKLETMETVINFILSNHQHAVKLEKIYQQNKILSKETNRASTLPSTGEVLTSPPVSYSDDKSQYGEKQSKKSSSSSLLLISITTIVLIVLMTLSTQSTTKSLKPSTTTSSSISSSPPNSVSSTSSSSSQSGDNRSSSTSSAISSHIISENLLKYLNHNRGGILSTDVIETITKIVTQNMNYFTDLLASSQESDCSEFKSKKIQVSGSNNSNNIIKAPHRIESDDIVHVVKDKFSAYAMKKVNIPIHWISLGSSLTLGDFKHFNDQTGQFNATVSRSQKDKFSKYLWVIHSFPSSSSSHSGDSTPPVSTSSLQAQHHWLLNHYLYYDKISLFLNDKSPNDQPLDNKVTSYDRGELLSSSSPNFPLDLSDVQILLTNEPILSMYNIQSEHAGHYFCYELTYDNGNQNMNEFHNELAKILSNPETSKFNPSYNTKNLEVSKILSLKLILSNLSHSLSLLTSSIIQISRPSRVKIDPIFHEFPSKTSSIRLDIQFEELGFPLPNLIWKKNGYPLQNTNKFQNFLKLEDNPMNADESSFRNILNTITKDDKNSIDSAGVSTLFLSSTSSDDNVPLDDLSGTYTCQIENFASSLLWTEACIQVNPNLPQAKINEASQPKNL